MSFQILSVEIRREEGLYVAECPEAGTVCHGHSIEEAIANLREVTEVTLNLFTLREAPLRTSFLAAAA
jgi:predicted RNase H-like HicB family nuclease